MPKVTKARGRYKKYSWNPDILVPDLTLRTIFQKNEIKKK